MDGGSWHCTGGSDQDHLQEKEMQKGKMVVWGGLTNNYEKKRTKGKGEKERYTHLNAEFQRIAGRDKKGFLSDQSKELEENNRMGKIRDLFKKIRDTREHYAITLTVVWPQAKLQGENTAPPISSKLD